jgi:hypothetical protein
MAVDSAVFGGLAGALFGALLALGVVLTIAVWVYFGFVLQTIAKKLKYKKDWLAWVPVARWALIPILAKKHWAHVFWFLLPIVNIVLLVVWMWKIYERRKYPGALALIFIAHAIPFVSWAAWIANLIVLGLVAWRDK